MIQLAYSNTDQRGDLVRTVGNLATDRGLETAVVISLFSDGRAKPTDDLGSGVDPRGWWGAAHLAGRDPFGSRLWQLKRAKLTTENLQQAAAWAEESLRWLVTAGVAKRATASVERLALTAVKLTVDIQRPQQLAPKWRGTWEVQLGL